MAFRFISVGAHPDHDTLATFRRRFSGELADLFIQVLEVAQEMKLVKLGSISLDGTRIHANASRHSALSYGHIEKMDTQLQSEVQKLLGLAEQADTTSPTKNRASCRCQGAVSINPTMPKLLSIKTACW